MLAHKANEDRRPPNCEIMRKAVLNFSICSCPGTILLPLSFGWVAGVFNLLRCYNVPLNYITNPSPVKRAQGDMQSHKYRCCDMSQHLAMVNKKNKKTGCYAI